MIERYWLLCVLPTETDTWVKRKAFEWGSSLLAKLIENEGLFFLQWANEMHRDRFCPLIKALFSLFRIGIEWWDRQGQRRLAINLFNNFLLSDGLSSLQVFAVSLQRFTFDVASQTQLGGNLSVVSLIIASEWAGRLEAFRRFLSKNTDSSDIICVCSLFKTWVKWTVT